MFLYVGFYYKKRMLYYMKHLALDDVSIFAMYTIWNQETLSNVYYYILLDVISVYQCNFVRIKAEHKTNLFY